MNQKKSFPAGILASAAAALLAVGFFLLHFNIVRDKIYEVNAKQITEQYEIVSGHFVNQANGNYNHLVTIESVLKFTDEPLDDFFRISRECWGYTDLYFIRESGEYISSDGTKGRFDFNERARYAIREKEKILAMGSIPDKGDTAFYIKTVDNGVYMDFPYEAIAIGYDKSAVADSLSVSLYSGTADTFVVSRDGRIVFSDYGENISSIYTILSEKQSYSHSDLNSLKKVIRTGGKWNSLIKIDGEIYYAAALDMGFHDWTMIGLIPEDEVNDAMKDVQKITMAATGALLFLFMMTVIIGILRKSRINVRRTKEQLLYREQLFDVLSNQTDEVLIMFSPNSITPEYVSPNIEKVMGTPLSEAQKNIFSIRPGSTDAEKKKILDKFNSLNAGTPEYLEWKRINPKTEETQWFSETLLRVKIADTDRCVIVFSDISREVENRTRMKEALDIAETANRAKSSFLSNMSHDIRTPLNAVIGFCLLLEKDADDPAKVRDYTAKIKTSGNHLLDLINDVLDMSKIESGKTTLNMSEFSLKSFVSDIRLLISQQAQAKQQEFTVNISDIIHDRVTGDRLRLNQILLNILSNAVKYTPAGGKISFCVSECEQTSHHTAKYRFIVSDNGIGMSEDYIKVLFEPFTREKNDNIGKIQGTGLGMAITYNLVMLMDGNINVQSTVGEGSTFTVEIELLTEENITQNSSYSDSALSETDSNILDGRRFLIAEDNELNAEILIELLQIEGASGEVCTNGREIYERFLTMKDGEFDAILMDIQMPVMNGYDATKAIRRSGSPFAETIPIIAMTANAFDEDIRDSLTSGMNAHVSKPVNMDMLKKAFAETISIKE